MERTAEWMKAEARKWVDDNPLAWGEMKEIASLRASLGRRFSIGQLTEYVRFSFTTFGKSDGFKMNNSLRAELARMLIEEVPQCRPFIETRKSKVDNG